MFLGQRVLNFGDEITVWPKVRVVNGDCMKSLEKSYFSIIQKTVRWPVFVNNTFTMLLHYHKQPELLTQSRLGPWSWWHLILTLPSACQSRNRNLWDRGHFSNLQLSSFNEPDSYSWLLFNASYSRSWLTSETWCVFLLL